MSLIREESWPLTKTLAGFVFGHAECDLAEHTHIYNLMKENIKTLNNSLKGRQFLVGNALTVADLQLTLCVMEMQ